MKRSGQVVAPLLTAMALGILAGCREPEMQRCVDAQNHVVDDKFCANLPQNQSQQQPGVVFVPMYRYYYGGMGGYAPGSIATGGGYTPSAGVSYATSTTRGGFGGSFSGGCGEGGDAAGS